MALGEALALASDNVLSPSVLCFFLGAVATLVRSDLKIPEAVYSLLTTYLLFAIGLKGGAELSHAPLEIVWKPLACGVALGVVTPAVAFIGARAGRQSVADAAALAAHYGSVSVVTFIATMGFLERLGTPAESHVNALVVVMEVPAIVLALLIAHVLGPARTNGPPRRLREAMREVVTGRSLLLMLGGLVIGILSGTQGYARVEPFFGPPFQGVVALFLLEMGMLAARRLQALRRAGAFVVAFGTCVPLINAALGLALARGVGLALPEATVLSTLAASASYIAAPAAVRLALPEANPSLYLNAALTVTFPFNLIIGIPLYHAAARFVYGL